MQQKAFIKLLGLRYKLVYKKGQDNKAADALSRQSHDRELHAISVSTPKWLETLIEGYQKDQHKKDLIITGSNDKSFTLVDGVIKHKGRIWLGNQTNAHQVVLLALHSSGLGGYFAITTTYQ